MIRSMGDERRRALERAFDRVIHIVFHREARQMRRFIVTRTVEVEAVDAAQALLLAEYGEGLMYEPSVEEIKG